MKSSMERVSLGDTPKELDKDTYSLLCHYLTKYYKYYTKQCTKFEAKPLQLYNHLKAKIIKTIYADTHTYNRDIH